MRRRSLTWLVALASGLLFAIGLGVAGMTDPSKVLGFLDVAGAWDPSLALVMASAVGVHASFLWLLRRRVAPVLASGYQLPKATAIDPRLLVGAALFGVGWGIAGYCPGPVVVSVVTLAPCPLLFVVTMLGGMLTHEALFRATAPVVEEGGPRVPET